MNAATDTPQACLCFNLRKAARAVTQLYDAALEPAGLRATQFSLLAVLDRRDGRDAVTITDLARAMVMDRTTLTRNLRPIEKQGLVAIAPGDDRRTREVRLTQRGRTALTRATPRWRHAQTRMLDALGDRRARRLLGELSGAIDAARRQ